MRNLVLSVLVCFFSMQAFAEIESLTFPSDLFKGEIWTYGNLIKMSGPKAKDYENLIVDGTRVLNLKIDRQADVVKGLTCFEDCTQNILENAKAVFEEKIISESPEETVLSTDTITAFILNKIAADFGIKGMISGEVVKESIWNGWSVLNIEVKVFSGEGQQDADATLQFTWVFRPRSKGTNFEVRKPIEGATYFSTLKSKVPVIPHIAVPSSPMKVYLLQVPEFIKPAWSKALQVWSSLLKEATGKDFFDFEFVDQGDARLAYLIPGDPRYNIVLYTDELLPTAFGRPTYDQVTGEIFNFHVLIPGGKNYIRYKNWYSFYNIIDNQGDLNDLPPFHTDYLKEFDKTLSVNEAFLRESEGKISHEFGHALGLDHNLKGSLFNSVNSAMDVIAPENTKNQFIGPYDKAAILWGYAGVEPANKAWTCSSQESEYGEFYNPECSFFDGTSDPFGHYLKKLRKVFFVNVAPTKPLKVPVFLSFPINGYAGPLREVATALFMYSNISESVFNRLNAFKREGRPTQFAEMKPYVLNEIRSVVCDASFDAVAGEYEDANLVAAAKYRLNAFRNFAKKIGDQILGEGVFLGCMAEQ